MRALLDERKLLPLLCRILTMVSSLRDQYFYEVEMQSFNLMVTLATEATEVGNYDFMLVNQSIPLVYRHMVQNVVGDLYGETEYEFNEACLLKKVAAFLVKLATDIEPEKEHELFEICQKWHDQQLVQAPKEPELKMLLDEAFRIVSSLSDPTQLATLSETVNNIETFIAH